MSPCEIARWGWPQSRASGPASWHPGVGLRGMGADRCRPRPSALPPTARRRPLAAGRLHEERSRAILQLAAAVEPFWRNVSRSGGAAAGPDLPTAAVQLSEQTGAGVGSGCDQREPLRPRPGRAAHSRPCPRRHETLGGRVMTQGAAHSPAPRPEAINHTHTTHTQGEVLGLMREASSCHGRGGCGCAGST